LEAAIVEAARQELAEAGYVNFSIERLAARAGTSKPVIYRRWPTRARLVYAAAFGRRPHAPATALTSGRHPRVSSFRASSRKSKGDRPSRPSRP
jgi:AcrR family transcriptional regulator